MDIPEENQIRYKSNYVKGIVRDKKTRQPLAATIELINLENNEMESLVSSDSISGAYLIVLTQGAEYALYVNRKAYLFRSLNFNYSALRDYEPIVLDIDLEKAEKGTTAVLQNIFFDVDKYDLKEKSVTELQKILRFLKENPSFKVEISGHTDNVGADAYNLQLSQRRAQSVFNYLVESGIDARRLSPEGYGAAKPLAPNTSEEGRRQNRRIEFKLTH